MEGSESETVFESLNLNPQLFINQVLNTVDDVVDEAFDFFYEDASTKFNTEATQRSQELRKGVDSIRGKVQSVLDKQLSIWEKYSLHHCFSVPQGFVLPNTDESRENGSLHPDVSFDPDIDAQLGSMRKKLAEVGEESEMLNQEIQALERQSSLNAGYIEEAVRLYEQNSLLFQEIVTTAAELRTKMTKLKTGMIEENEQVKIKRICTNEMDLSAINPAKGLSNAELEDLQEILTTMKT
ncbi:PREDICTED: protein MIS12 homolog isoform X2 [Lupinus angustifolius]|uniref:protein MIS12 homolog isoform X2 n=1 Tax=Lupinus angustifolius TaxID=3871 RepID=UPI00092F813B|nr:PREDICTED: protein MIS12 homolog isoform X2 [Lupinus angustifolius]